MAATVQLEHTYIELDKVLSAVMADTLAATYPAAAITTLAGTETLPVWDGTARFITTANLAAYVANETVDLDGLSDVTITTGTAGDILYTSDGTNWVNTAQSTLSITESQISDLGTTVAMVADNLSVFAATTSAQLAGVISNETGTGSLVFATSPTLVTPALGTPSALVLTNATSLPEAQVTNHQAALSITESQVSDLGTTVAMAADNLSVFAATTSLQLLGVISDETGTGSLVFATSPTLVTPALGTPASGVLTNTTGYAAADLTASQVTDFSTAADARIAAAVLDNLSDVTETTITTGDVLRWNGSAWVNYADSAYGTSAAVALNTTHRTSDGSDHTFIDQSVVSGATPTFTGTNITGVPAASILAGTFGTGAFVFDNTVSGITTLTATTLAGTLSTATQNSVTTMTGLTTVGTIDTGTWQGTAIADGYIAGAAGWDTAVTHITSTGADHTWIDQDVTSGASPTFDGTNITGLPTVGSADTIASSAKKGSVGTITAGTVVYLTGWNVGGGYIEVEEADASVASTMPAIGVASTTITNVTAGTVVFKGVVTGLDTSGYSVNDALYVSETTGLMTNVKPTGAALIQKIALVARSNITVGVIRVVGAGRSNDVPNLASTNFWLGNGSGVATAVAMSADATMDNTGAVTLAATNTNLTTLANVTTVGALNSGSITSGFGSIDIGASTITTTGAAALGNTTITEAAGAASLTIVGSTHSQLYLNSDTAAAGGQQGMLQFQTNGTDKWRLGHSAAATFWLYNYTTAAEAFSVAAADSAVTFAGAITTTGTAATGALTVTTGASGGSANANADDITIHGSGNAGISILTPDASSALIYLGSASDAKGASFQWNHDSNLAQIMTDKVGASIEFSADNNVENLVLSGALGSELATFAGDVTLSSGNLTVTGTGAFSSTVGVLSTGTAAHVGLYLSGTGLSGTSQYGMLANPTFSSGATSSGRVLHAQLKTAAAAYTMTNGYGFTIASPSVGAGSTITNAYGLKVEDQAAGGTLNYAIYTGTGLVSFGDKVGIGATSLGSDKLDVYSATATTNLAIFQHNSLSDGYSIISATVGNSLTGSGNAFRGSGSTTGNLALAIQQNGAGTAMLDLLTLGAGDAVARFRINGGQAWSIGLDNTDSDSFKIAGSSALGTSDYVTIDTSGNVGIGETAPAYKLEVAGTVSSVGGTSGGFYFNENGNIQQDASYNWLFSTNGVANVMSIESATGNVGIGTTSPANLLQVDSGAAPTDSQFIVTANGAGGVSVLNYAVDNSGLFFDAHWESTGWKSLDAGSSFGIYKNVDLLSFVYDTAAVGAGVVWNTGFVLDATGNVGIGTTSPGVPLHVVGSMQLAGAAQSIFFTGADGVANNIGLYYVDADDTLYLRDNGSSANRIAFKRDGLVQVGANATYPLRLEESGGACYVRSSSANSTTGANLHLGTLHNADAVVISANGGNVGIGTTDVEAWYTGFNALEWGGGNIMGHTSTPGLWTTSNAYYDGSWKYKTTAVATLYQQTGGLHSFYTFPSGTIDTAITIGNPAFQIDNDGNLSVGNTTPDASYIFKVVSDTNDLGMWSAGGFHHTVSHDTAAVQYDTNSSIRGWAWSINGSEKVIIATSGNVGIGQTTPVAALHLGSTAGTAASGINFGGDTNLYRPSANVLKTDDVFHFASDIYVNNVLHYSGGGTPISIGSASELRVYSGGLVAIGDTANTNMTQGLTVNMGSNSDEIIALKSTSISHGMTTNAEHDTFGTLSRGGSGGAVTLAGYSTGYDAVYFSGRTTTETAVRTTAAIAPFYFSSQLKSGTTVGAPGANKNMMVITANGTTRFIFDSDGDSHQDVGTAWTNFDHEQDAMVVRSVGITMGADSIIKSRFDDWSRDHKADLIRTGLIPELTAEQEANGERPLMNTTQLARLHNGAIWQNYEAIMDTRSEVEQLKAELKEEKALNASFRKQLGQA